MRVAGALGFHEGGIDFKDGALGAAVAMLFLVLAAGDWTSVEDVGRVVAADAVKVEEGGVQLATEQEPAILVPLRIATR